MRRKAALVVVLATLVAVAGCGSSGSSTPAASASSTTRATPGVTGTITVLAAASLTETFTKIGKDFEAANPGTSVRLSFGGSSTLAQQINAGAPADVFASASPTNMGQVQTAAPSTVFAKNQLVIAVPKGNPKGIKGLADLTGAGVKVAMCAEAVPCGAAAKKALEAAGVKLTPVTLEQDVKAALSKVKLGEVDAALVYRTDARSAPSDVDGVEFAESAKAINDYPIAVLAKAPNAAGAAAFVTYVLSAPARSVLTSAGFQQP